ncbi:MAG TPA: hypothetical protein VKH64_07005 [Candidatus Binatia bacterium]|nr:hypothetical protein [Candidatus Binatia bacterium]
MKRISSRWTFFHKRIFPWLWFGGLAVFFIVPALISANQPPFIFVVPLLLGIFSYFFFKHLLFDLVDEAWDAGDYLVFKNNGLEEMVRLENIMNVSSSTFTNPPRVTLTLRTPSRLGKEITFSPPASMNPLNAFKKPPIVDELIQRVDRAINR